MALDAPNLRYARRAMSPQLLRARMLAAEIEELLTGLSPDEADAHGYQLRLAEGLTRSLIDQLEELERGPVSGTRRTAVLEESSYPGRAAARLPGR